jgi:competence protein ComEA
MRTRTTPAGSPHGDRLERLLGGADDEPPGAPADADAALVEPAVDGQDVADGWETDAGEGHLQEPLEDHPSRGRHRVAGVPLLSVPGSLRSSDLGVGRRAVRGLLVVVVAATLVLGGRWLWVERVAVASPPERVVPSAAGDHLDAQTTATVQTEAVAAPDIPGAQVGMETVAGHGQGQGESASTQEVVVHVAGEVTEPGVVEVPAGSRVVDALRAAGGATEQADQSTLNLARPLTDGERIWVGRPGETPPVVPGPAVDAGGGGSAAGTGAGTGRSGPLDLNAATQADLEELPGVGPVTAGHILAWRQEHGRFASVQELLEVSGIGERTLAQLEPLVTVGG